MGKPGIIAFPVLLALGALTGYLTYTNFGAAIPQEGIVDSPYRKDLPAADTEKENKTGGGHVDESEFSKVVTISIPEGASVQGSADYEPEPATVSVDALVTWVNNDSALHSATSGTGPEQENFGSLFDTGLIGPGEKSSIPASQIGKGEHDYFCLVHPYMTSKIIVE